MTTMTTTSCLTAYRQAHDGAMNGDLDWSSKPPSAIADAPQSLLLAKAWRQGRRVGLEARANAHFAKLAKARGATLNQGAN